MKVLDWDKPLRTVKGKCPARRVSKNFNTCGNLTQLSVVTRPDGVEDVVATDELGGNAAGQYLENVPERLTRTYYANLYPGGSMAWHDSDASARKYKDADCIACAIPFTIDCEVGEGLND